MNSSTDLCLICRIPLSEGLIVTVTRGIPTLFKFSKIKQDNLFSDLTLKSVVLHSSCRKNYTRPVTDKKNDAVNREQRQTVAFNFKVNCFFCGLKCVKDRKLTEKQSQNIHLVIQRKSRIEIGRYVNISKNLQVETIEFRANIMEHCATRDCDVSKRVTFLLSNINDLVAAECRYHGHCYRNIMRPLNTSSNPVGRPVVDPVYVESFKKLCKYVDDNEECQYDMDQLVSILRDYLPNSHNTVDEPKLRGDIKAKYKDNVKISRLKTGKLLFNFHVSDNLPSFERSTILKKAAAILFSEVRAEAYDCDSFPNLKDIPIETHFPRSFNMFMNEWITKHKTGLNKARIERKVFAIQEAITSLIRERSYVSPLLTNLGIHLHRKYDSR